MSFPTVVGTRGLLTESGNSSTHAVPYPTGVSGGIQSGDLLIMLGCEDTYPITMSDWGAFSSLKTIQCGTSDATAFMGYKWAAGSESGSHTFTTDTSERGTWAMYCIRGADTNYNPVVSTGVTSAGTNANPDDLTSGWGSQDVLWIACAGWDNPITASGAPTNFTDLGAFPGATSSASIAIAFYQLTAASVTVGNFTSATEDWAAWTAAVRGLSGTNYNDNPSGTISLSGSKTESKEHSQSPTGTVGLAGTRTESKVYTETRSGTIALSGTVPQESWYISVIYTDSPDGTIILAGSISEEYIPPVQGPTYNDSPSGTLRVRG